MAKVFSRARTVAVSKYLYPDVLPAFRYLRESTAGSLQIGVMTNGYIDLEVLKSEAQELLECVSFVMCAAQVGAQKPSPVPFIAIAHHLHVGPSEILYVGDSYSKDVLASRKCGMNAVWLRRELPDHPFRSMVADSYASLPESEWPETPLASLSIELIRALLRPVS